MNVKTIGIDLAKEVFQVHGIDEHGKRLFNKQLKRAKMLSFFANIPPCLMCFCPLLGRQTHVDGP